VDVEIRPEPEPAERDAILAALEGLPAEEQRPPAYVSAWRAEGIRENVEDATGEDRD
jgi:hypothetical protein